MDFSSSVGFIGTDGTMFNLQNGSVVKRYDGNSDRMIVESYGDMQVSGIKMRVGTSNIDSKDYVLPVGSNFTVRVMSGTITMSQKLSLLPGAIVEVAEGAHCVLKSGYAVYVYDSDEWGRSVATRSMKLLLGPTLLAIPW